MYNILLYNFILLIILFEQIKDEIKNKNEAKNISSNKIKRHLSQKENEQQLNNIINIYNPFSKVSYISSIVSKNGDLFITINSEEMTSTRLIYAIKSDGSNFFTDNDNKPYKIMESENVLNNYPSLCILNLFGKDYLISFCIDSNFELYDFSQNETYSLGKSEIIESDLDKYKNTFTSLNYYDNKDYIIINSYFLLQKLKVNINIEAKEIEIIQNDKIELSSIYFSSSSFTCFEALDLIECLFLDYRMFYSIGIFNISNLEKIHQENIEKFYRSEYFSKCIHIKDYIGAFIYFINDLTPVIQFKKFNIISSNSSEYELEDYRERIIINSERKYGLGYDYIFNDIIKIDENNIIYVDSDALDILMIILVKLFDTSRSILVNYYKIELKQKYNISIYRDNSVFKFNGLLGIGMINYNFSLSENITYANYFIIGEAFENNITIPDNGSIFGDEEDNKYQLIIKDFISIKNNIFGYEFNIRIISDINEDILGFYLYSNELQKKIETNLTISSQDIINFELISGIGVKKGNYSFEYEGQIKEADYNTFLSFPDSFEIFPNSSNSCESFYEPKTFSSKKGFFSFSVNYCYKTCKTCTYLGDNTTHYCDTCSEDFPFIYNVTNSTLGRGHNCLESCPANYTIGKYNACEPIEYDNINGDTNKIINKLNATDIMDHAINSSFVQRIFDLLDGGFGNNINLTKIFSDGLINSKIENIILNGDNDLIINNSETIIQITSTDNQRKNKNPNLSTIDFEECEENLKRKYNINPNKPILIIKIDSFIVGSKIPVIQYELYHPDNMTKLDLSLCNNKIKVNIPVSIDENELYKYEQGSDYYNDRCKNDKPLKSRRKEFINNNMTLCESECDYIGYDYETKNAKCECEIKKQISIFNIKIDTERLYNKFTGLTSSNIDIIKCYYLLFKKVNLMYNIGFYIILFIIIIFCIGAITFVFKGYNLLVKKVDIVAKTNHLMKTKPLEIKDNMNKIKRNKNKNKKRKKKKNKNNPPIKKVKNGKRKKRNIGLDLSNAVKSTQKLNTKNNESLVKNINNEKGKESKNTKSKKSAINKSKLVTDVPNGKISSLNNSQKHLIDCELNRLQYKEAIMYDKRTYFQYYWSLLKIGNLFLFSFMPNNDYNSMVIKICLFFFSFGLYYTVNALFFTDSTMDKIYEDNGKYDFIYEIPKILYSNLICTVINLIVRFLSLSQKDILSIKIIKKKENLANKVINIKKCLKIKFIFYYLINFLFLFIFWFYVSCFCAVYKNTQIYLIKDTLISFSLSLLYPLGYYLIPGILRLPALRNTNMECIYKTSLLLQSL